MIADFYYKEWKVEFNDCNSNGSLSYVSLSRFLQDTAGLHANASSYGLYDMLKNRQSWVLAKLLIEIESLPKLGDTITVKTWIKFVDGAVSDRDYQVILNGQVIVGASSSWIVINLDARRPEKLKLSTDNIVFIKQNATSQPCYKVDLDFSFEHFENKIVRFSALDMLNHVSNLRYLEWMLDAIDYKIILKSQIKSIAVNYIKELKLNEKLEIVKHNSLLNSKILMRKESGQNCFAAEIEWK